MNNSEQQQFTIAYHSSSGNQVDSDSASSLNDAISIAHRHMVLELTICKSKFPEKFKLLMITTANIKGSANESWELSITSSGKLGLKKIKID